MPAFNRNGAIGRYAEFAPVRRSLDELIAAIRGDEAKTIEPPTSILELGDAELVRYRLGSPALQRDLDAVGANGPTLSDAPDITSVFGVVQRNTGALGAILAVYDDRGLPRLAFVLTPSATPVGSSDMLEVLQYLDVPPSGGTGADHKLASAFDCWFSDDGWKLVAPRHLIAVGFERTCFSLEPTINERLDVLLLEDDARPLDGAGDSDAAYWNVDHYRALGFDRLQELNTSIRPGFSSWFAKDVRRVKVIGRGLAAELEALEAARDASTPSI